MMHPAITLANMIASRRFLKLILCIKLLMTGNLSVQLLRIVKVVISNVFVDDNALIINLTNARVL